MYDSCGRSVDYLRISVTDRCNLRCVYCVPAEEPPRLPREEILSFEQIREVARAAHGLGFRKFRLTGGEPLVRSSVVDLVAALRRDLPLSLLAMTTNGTLLAPLAADLARSGLDSVNVSLDTLDADRYASLTRGGRLSDVLAGIDAALASGLKVKLNAVVLEDSVGAELDALRTFADRRGAALQLIREYRLDQVKRDGGDYDRPPPCASCNRVRVTADGRLLPCLHSRKELPLDFSDLRGSLERCILAKPPRGESRSEHALRGIGG